MHGDGYVRLGGKGVRIFSWCKGLYWVILSVSFGIIFRLYFYSEIKCGIDTHCSINCEE